MDHVSPHRSAPPPPNCMDLSQCSGSDTPLGGRGEEGKRGMSRRRSCDWYGVTSEWKSVLSSIYAVLLLGAAWNVYLRGGAIFFIGSGGIANTPGWRWS